MCGFQSDLIILIILFYSKSTITEPILQSSLQYFESFLMKHFTQYAQQYQILGELGDGGQATVYLAKKEQELFAVKVYQIGTSKLEAFQRQVDFLSKLKHQHLINIVDSKVDAKIKLQNKEEQTRPIIVLEYAEGGELFELISQNGGLRPQLSRRIFKQLIQCLQFLLQKGISHRDIKPQNILFDKNFNIKLSDFGLATKTQGENGDEILTTRLGTQGYKSPQMEMGKYKGIESDIFAAGVTLFIMCSGGPPFMSTKSNDKIYKYIKEKNFTRFWNLHEKKKGQGYYSESFKKLINSFFSYDSDKRPTLESLKENEWMNESSASIQELQSQFTEISQKVLQQNDGKMNLQKIKCELFKKQVKEQEQAQELTRGIYSQFMLAYNQHSYLQIQDLPQNTKQSLIKINHKPSFVVAWLSEFLKNAMKNKNSFIYESSIEIQDHKYSIQLNQEDSCLQIKMNLFYDEQIQEIELKGQMFRIKKQMGLGWKKEKGNGFWQNSILRELNHSLKSLY